MKPKKFTKLRVLTNGINDACGLAIDEFEHWERSLDEMTDDELNGYVSMIIDLSEQVKATFKDEAEAPPAPEIPIDCEEGEVYMVTHRNGNMYPAFFHDGELFEYKNDGEYRSSIVSDVHVMYHLKK